MAKDAKEAIKKDKDTPVHDVWVSEDWLKNNSVEDGASIGFNTKKKNV